MKVFIVVIGSGEEAKKVRVSGPLLSANSFYFKRALAEPWFGADKTLEFPHYSADTFEIFMVWLNAGDTKYASCLQKIEDGTQEVQLPQLAARWSQLLRCYTMADYIQAPKYTNVIMDALIETLRHFEGVAPANEISPLCNATAESITFVWENTFESSPLRKLCLDTIITTRHIEWPRIKGLFYTSDPPSEGCLLTVPVEFLLDLIELESRLRGQRQDPPWTVRTEYHVNQDLPEPGTQ